MIKLFKNFNSKQMFFIFVSFIFIIIQVWLELRIPDYMSNITTLVQTGGTTGDIALQGLHMLLCAFGSLISSFVVGYIIANTCSTFSTII